MYTRFAQTNKLPSFHFAHIEQFINKYPDICDREWYECYVQNLKLHPMRANLPAHLCSSQQERKENFLGTVESEDAIDEYWTIKGLLFASSSILRSLSSPSLFLWNKSTYFCFGFVSGRRGIWKTCVVWLLEKARAREAERRSKADNITYFFL